MLRRLLRVDPDAHRIVASPENLDLADALDTGKAILDVEGRIVAQIGDVVAVILRDQVDDHDEVRRTLHRGEAQCPYLGRQTRFGLRHPVLDKLLGLVRIRAELECHGHGEDTIRRRLAGHVEHVLDAVDLLFEGCCDRLGNDGRVGAGISGPHDDGWRHDLRVFRNRQGAQADQTRHHDQD